MLGRGSEYCCVCTVPQGSGLRDACVATGYVCAAGQGSDLLPVRRPPTAWLLFCDRREEHGGARALCTAEQVAAGGSEGEALCSITASSSN